MQPATAHYQQALHGVMMQQQQQQIQIQIQQQQQQQQQAPQATNFVVRPVEQYMAATPPQQAHKSLPKVVGCILALTHALVYVLATAHTFSCWSYRSLLLIPFPPAGTVSSGWYRFLWLVGYKLYCFLWHVLFLPAQIISSGS